MFYNATTLLLFLNKMALILNSYFKSKFDSFELTSGILQPNKMAVI